MNGRVKSATMVSRLTSLFQTSLKRYPVMTNMAVYASFYVAADLSQQTFNKYNTPEKPEVNVKSSLRIAAVGSTIYAPTLYFWYKFLDRKMPGKAMATVLTKVACDQFIMTPILLATFFTAFGILDRKADIFEELKQKYWTAFIANQSFWIPAQTVNFALVPPNLRVVYVATVSYLWINVLCFIKRQSYVKAEK